MLAISRDVYEEMVRISISGLPNEVCGVLLGIGGTITRLVPIRNVAANPRTHFSFDPDEWIEAMYSSGSLDDDIVGIFHSHPDMAAIPSEEDLRHYHYGHYSYWIISLQSPSKPVIQAWAYVASEHRFEPISYTITRRQ